MSQHPAAGTPAVLRPWQLPTLPAVLALVTAWASLTPSLLPRSAPVQGLLLGIAAALGYGAGSFIRFLLADYAARIPARVRRIARAVLAAAGLAGTAVVATVTFNWQQAQRTEIGMDPASPLAGAVVVLIGLAIFAVLLVIFRAVRALGRLIKRGVARLLPLRLAAAIATALTAAAVIWVVNSVLVGTIAGHLDKVFLLANEEYATDQPAPTLTEVSGGPDSLSPWEELGRQGRVFVTNTPTAAEITDFTGAAALQPIRVYAGAGGNHGVVDLEEQADLAVAELIRTGAFERSVINIVTGTGRGWVNEHQTRALEYMWGGDTATVSIQYSMLPSPLSYLVDSQRAQDAGRLLFDAVYAHWLTLPADERPQLVVSGESLGSYGGESAFSGAQDLAARTSGALWVGPTANNALWQRFTAERDDATPQWQPTYRGGATIRFSDDGATWAGTVAWSEPRVGYLQHANDPVTWLDFGTAFTKPDFLVEERGPGVPDQMTWWPVITLLQIAADGIASDIPAGQGHEYAHEQVRAWAYILPQDGWSDADTERLWTHLQELDATSLS